MGSTRRPFIVCALAGVLVALLGCSDREVTTPPSSTTPVQPGTPSGTTPTGTTPTGTTPPGTAPGGAPAIVLPPKQTPAIGSGVFNVNAQPNFETRLVSIGMNPDPMVIPVVSGGNLSASSAGITGVSCTGWVTARPDVDIQVTTAMPLLRFYVTPRGGEDTTLIINKPDGSWVCNDDRYGRNPGIDIANAMPGVYNIWIGSFTSGTQAQGTLSIATSATLVPSSGSGGGNTPPLNPGAEPNFGARELAPGFAPVAIDVVSGGSVPAMESVAGASCRGHVSPQPDFNFTLSGDQPQLRVFVDHAANNADTTLVMQMADGSYLCNDDTNGSNPQIDVPVATAGVVHVWVGSYSDGVQARARLNITQRATSHARPHRRRVK